MKANFWLLALECTQCDWKNRPDDYVPFSQVFKIIFGISKQKNICPKCKGILRLQALFCPKCKRPLPENQFTYSKLTRNLNKCSNCDCLFTRWGEILNNST